MRKHNGQLKKFNHIRYSVSKELIDQYERTFGVAKQFISWTKPGVNILKPKEKLDPIQPLVKTIIQKSCYTYYNKETLKHINSFEPLELSEPSWTFLKLTVSVLRFVSSKQVLKPLERLCWIYYNTRTGDQWVSFWQLEKTEEEVELCESITVPQFDEHSKTFPIKVKLKEIDINKEIQIIEKENREFATEEEIQQESQCLENVKEMGVQVTIKHIKEENKNDDNLKAYICHELSLKSSQHNGNVKVKKSSPQNVYRIEFNMISILWWH